MNNKVLILGNSHQINNIKFDKLQKDIITVGANRIWYKFIPNYLSFTDPEIFYEMKESDVNIEERFRNCKLISNDWLLKKGKPKYKEEIINSGLVTFYNVLTNISFPDSASCGLVTYNSYINRESNPVYYVAGVSLNFNKEKNHFWTGDYKTKNHHDMNWYKPRFDKMFLNWINFKKMGINIISVTPNSRLNELFPYQDISTLYET